MTQTVWADDPVVQPLIAMARTNPDIECLILSGSRGARVQLWGGEIDQVKAFRFESSTPGE